MTKEEAESRFKLIGEALEILGDTHKRKLYDDGHDKEVMTCTYKWSPVLLFLDAREQCAVDFTHHSRFWPGLCFAQRLYEFCLK